MSELYYEALSPASVTPAQRWRRSRGKRAGEREIREKLATEGNHVNTSGAARAGGFAESHLMRQIEKYATSTRRESRTARYTPFKHFPVIAPIAGALDVGYSGRPWSTGG